MNILQMYEKMLKSLVPENLEKQLKTEKGTLGEGVKYILLAALVADIVLLIAVGIDFMLLEGTVTQEQYGPLALALGVSVTFVAMGMLVFYPAAMVVFSLVSNGVMFLICRLLGGKGSYDNHFYHFAIVGGALSIATDLLSFIPCLGDVVTLVLWIYALYLAFLIYRSVHKLDDLRAAVAVLLPIATVIIAVAALGAYLAIGETQSGLLA